jgi:hypothetical protein
VTTDPGKNRANVIQGPPLSDDFVILTVLLGQDHFDEVGSLLCRWFYLGCSRVTECRSTNTGVKR